ncbi:MAG: Hint domain-containing protein [Octadecabacter sp.]
MPTYSFYIISNSVLSYNWATSEFDFSASYDHTVHRYRIDVTDDDTTMDSTGDGNQTAMIYDMGNNLIDSGVIEVPAFATTTAPGGGTVHFDRIEVDGVHYGYLPSEDLTPGDSYAIVTSADDDLDHTYFEDHSVPCFAPDTMISTARGEVSVQRIKAGDLVLTLDHGYQPVAWVGCWRIPWPTLMMSSRHWPVTIAPPSNSNGRALTVSSAHRMLLGGPWFDLHVGTHEVLCRSGLMAPPHPPMPGKAMIWHHILLPQHEIICANGHWTESLFAGGHLFSDLPAQTQIEARAALDQGHMSPARQILRRHEAEVFFARNGATKAHCAA